MHEWLFANLETFDEASLRDAAPQMGLDASALFDAMGSPEVAAAIGEDALAAKRLGLRGVPFFWVDGRRVPFWRLQGEPLVERIIEEAAGAEGG